MRGKSKRAGKALRAIDVLTNAFLDSVRQKRIRLNATDSTVTAQ